MSLGTIVGYDTGMTQVPPNHRMIWSDGLWHNNPGLVQLLGLCPLLAVSSSVVNGLGLGLATMLVLTVSSTTVSAVRRWLSPEIRIPAFVLIIAATVTAVEMVFQAWFHDLSRTLGIFIPLIVTNCAIIARAEAFASRQRIGAALSDALANGTGFAAVLVSLGGMRELIGHGTLLSDLHLLLGDMASGASLQLLPADWQFLPALLPPGAFILLGLLVALRQYLQARPRTAAAAGTATA